MMDRSNHDIIVEKFGTSNFTANELATELSTPEDDAIDILEGFMSDGWIDQVDSDHYQVTRRSNCHWPITLIAIILGGAALVGVLL